MANKNETLLVVVSSILLVPLLPRSARCQSVSSKKERQVEHASFYAWVQKIALPGYLLELKYQMTKEGSCFRVVKCPVKTNLGIVTSFFHGISPSRLSSNIVRISLSHAIP